MHPSSVAFQRLCQQGISDRRFSTPGEVVSWLGAVQSQDYLGAKWSLGMRLRNVPDDAVEQAFTEGSILRTHILRPTWHFVAPEDIRWMLALTADRVKAKMAYYERQSGLDEDVFPRSNAVIAEALRGGVNLTRKELALALAQAGIVAEGVRLAYIIDRAELDAVICSGPRHGKQFTYALLEERAPQARTLDREEALGELTLRYFSGHGPATARDFAWWSGLTMADAKAGIEALGDALEQMNIDGTAYWFSAAAPPEAPPPPEAILLPTYDEFHVGYAGFDKLRRGGVVPKETSFYPSLLIDGQVAGRWQRTYQNGGFVFEIVPFSPLGPRQVLAVEKAKQDYARFFGTPLTGASTLET